MRLKGIRSLRELARILDVDKRIRRLCLIQRGERGYPRSVISRFTRRVGADVLQLIIEEKVIQLLRSREADVLLDASFIKARSIRHPDNGKIAYSDADALVGRNGRGYSLGYKLHLAVEHRTMLPLAVVLAPANENEKRHASTLVERAKSILGKAGLGFRSIIADSQYSGKELRAMAGFSVIPYMSRERKGEDMLRVDRRFRTRGPAELVQEYHKRPLVESVFSWLKTQYGMTVNNVRRLPNVFMYALLSLLCHVLVREAAECLGRPEKAVSPTFFNV
jgi:hypothetical protein